MEKFTAGLLIGMVGGAVLVANNYKARQLVRKSQSDLCEKFEDMLEEKLADKQQSQESES
ncbi:MAG: hypothetical protein J5993_01840 [Clostridia bacterium]|nr:hypothetical protein [Clostridia bacterium]